MTLPNGSHRLPRRRPTSAQVRALLSLGLLLGVGSVSTMASFSDDATMSAGSFATGTLDVRLNANTNNVGQGGTFANTTFAVPDLVPGESLASSFPVRNDGSVPFKYTATATAAAAGTNLAPALKFTTYLGGTASNGTTGTLRTGSCTGIAATSSQTLSATASTVVGTAQQVNVGASQSVCVLVSLPTATDNTFQGAGATASFSFNAVQLT